MTATTTWIVALVLLFSFLSFVVWRMRVRRVNVSIPNVANAVIEGDPAHGPDGRRAEVTVGNVRSGRDVRAVVDGASVQIGDVDAQGSVDLVARGVSHPKVR